MALFPWRKPALTLLGSLVISLLLPVPDRTSPFHRCPPFPPPMPIP